MTIYGRNRYIYISSLCKNMHTKTQINKTLNEYKKHINMVMFKGEVFKYKIQVISQVKLIRIWPINITISFCVKCDSFNAVLWHFRRIFNSQLVIRILNSKNMEKHMTTRHAEYFHISILVKKYNSLNVEYHSNYEYDYCYCYRSSEESSSETDEFFMEMKSFKLQSNTES